MAIFGSNPSSWSSWQWWGTNNFNEAATPNFVMPVDGIVTDVSVFVDSNGGTVTIQPLVWDSGGNVLVEPAAVNVGAGAQSVGGQHWHTTAVAGAGVLVRAGTIIRIGWRKAYASGSMLFSTAGGASATLYGTTASTLSGSSRSAGGAIGAYITYTPVATPTVTTKPASSVLTTTATLNGTVNPNGSDATVHFQWGTTTAYGNVTGNVDEGAGSAPINFSAGITGLTSGLTYHFRAVAVNAEGTVNGADQAFTATTGVPSAPTLEQPIGFYGAVDGINPANATLFDWLYNSNGAAAQTAYRLAIVHSATTFYWNGTSFISTLDGTSLIATPTTQVTIPANQTQLVAWAGSTVTFTVQTQDANGLGPFAAPVSLIIEAAPNAPTGLTPTGTHDLSGTPTFGYTYVPVNAVGGQTAFAMRRKIGAGAYGYWNGTDFSSSSAVWNPSSDQSITFSPAVWANGVTYLYSFATQDDGGQGVFAADATITGAVVGYLIDSGAVGGSRLRNVHLDQFQMSDGTLVFLDFNPDTSLTPNQVSLRYSPDHVSTPVLIGYVNSSETLGDGNAFSINAVGGVQAMAMDLDAEDNIFVIGQSNTDPDQVAVQAFVKVPGTLQWTAGPVLYGGGANTVLAGSTLLGFASLWCDTGRFGILFVVCDDVAGNKYAIMIDAGGVLNGVATLTMTVLLNPSFLGGINATAAGSNLDIAVDTFGSTSGLSVSSDPGVAGVPAIVVAPFSVTNSGRLAAPSATAIAPPQPSGPLIAGSKCRVISIDTDTFLVIYPLVGSTTALAVSVWSSSALLYGPVTIAASAPGAVPWPPVAGTLSWDVTAAPDAAGNPAAWLYSWDTVALHLDDLYRLSIGWNGTAIVFGATASTPAGTNAAVLDFAAVSGGGATGDMTALRLTRDPVDLLHVDWQAYKSDATFGLYGYFSSLPEAPLVPTLLYPITDTAGLISSALQLSWQFASAMFGDAQTGAYVRRQIQGGLYSWWNGSAWTTPQVGSTGGFETPVAGLTNAQSVNPTSWGIGSTYAWSVQTIGITGLLSGYASPVTFAVSNAPPPQPTLVSAFSSPANLTVLTFGLDPTDVTSSQGSIEYSDDGGTTWQFVRGATALIFPEADPTIQVSDVEVTPIYTRLYRAQTWTAFWPPGFSPYAFASESPPNLAQPWLVDPVDGLTLPLSIKPGSFTNTQLEDMTVTYPLGRKKPLVVFSDIHGQDGQITIVIQNFQDEAIFQELMQRQTVLLLMTPEPNHWYIRRTSSVSTDRPIQMMSGYREHTFTYVEVDRPAVLTN